MRGVTPIAMVLAGICALGGPRIAGQSGKQPRGLYVYSYPAFIRNGTFERALSVKGIDGAAVVMKWAEIQPTRDSPGRL